MNRKITFMVLPFVALIWFSACRSSHFATTANQPPNATAHANKPPNPMQHWVQDEELQRLMEKLGARTAANWPNTLPDDPETSTTASQREAAFKSSAQLAAALADAAEQIPHVVKNLSLSDADISAFIGTAGLLGDQARRLNTAARRHNVEDMQRLLDSTRATCISCHTRFKDIAGALPPRA